MQTKIENIILKNQLYFYNRVLKKIIFIKDRQPDRKNIAGTILHFIFLKLFTILLLVFMLNFDAVNDIPTTNKTVFLLTDLDVPIDEYGKIIDDSKIQSALPTINYLVKTGARVVIATHLGNPKNEMDMHFSTKPLAKYLDKRLHCDVFFCKTCIGEQSKHEIFRSGYGDVVVLENLLFYNGEMTCDINFAKQLADGMNIYVNDAFSYSNYSYASILCVPLFVRATGGFKLINDIKQLECFLGSSNRFSAAVIGGRMMHKINLFSNLIERIRFIAIGGIVANNFLKAYGYNIGKSQFEPECIGMAEKIFNLAEKNDCLLVLPKDVVVLDDLRKNKTQIKKITEIDGDDIIVDIGPESIKNICDVLSLSSQIFCYGNTGISEVSIAKNSTLVIADEIAKLKKKDVFSVVSGRDTILTLKNANYLKSFSFVSTATTATLQYMSGGILPGLEVLKRLSKQTW